MSDKKNKEEKEKKEEKTPQNLWSKIDHKIRQDSKLPLIIVIAVFLLAAIVSVFAYVSFGDDNLLNLKTKTSSSSLVPRHLDGTMVQPGQENNWPVGIMIENLAEIRPQHGLSSANVVYEALAEGGITRFMAIFDKGGDGIKEIAPVRSTRPYFLEVASEYDALYGHCGGSVDALGYIAINKVKDLDEMWYPEYYWRGTGYAPHNLFTSSEKLHKAISRKKLDNITPTYQSWAFKDEGKAVADKEVKPVILNFSTGEYQTKYVYDPAQNNYIRYNAGVEHQDANTGKAIRVKNVIVQVIEPPRQLDSYGRLEMNLNTTGKVLIFRDGQTIEGTWSRANRTSRTQFKDKDGQTISLDRGTTWVELFPSDKTLEY